MTVFDLIGKNDGTYDHKYQPKEALAMHYLKSIEQFDEEMFSIGYLIIEPLIQEGKVSYFIVGENVNFAIYKRVRC